MKADKTFTIFGEKVEIFVTGEMSNGAMTMLVQTSPPGGGVPPHTHTREDELFTVLEGEYEMFDEVAWHAILPGESYLAQRGGTHAFRNVGSKVGRLQAAVASAGVDKFLERLSPFSIPDDMKQIIDLSAKFGITIATSNEDN
jgi:quercetin dioxygenase-like cupin family protein